jgi:hypothetical protein
MGAKPYAQDFWKHRARAVLAGQSRREVACMFDVSASCVIKLMRRVDATSNCRARKFGGHKPDAPADANRSFGQRNLLFQAAPVWMDQPISGGGIGLPCAGFGPRTTARFAAGRSSVWRTASIILRIMLGKASWSRRRSGTNR